jgi:glucan-binding YG repeat protein
MDTSTKLAMSMVTQAVGFGVQAYGQVQQGKANQARANYQAAVARNNQIIANRQAEDARRRGTLEANLQRQKSRQLVEQQRASIAGAGVLVDQDSALGTIVGTAGLGELDALTIQSNAEREALQFEAQGVNFQTEAQLRTFEGKQAVSSSYLKAGGTLLTGFGSVSSKWYIFNKIGGSATGLGGGGFPSASPTTYGSGSIYGALPT